MVTTQSNRRRCGPKRGVPAWLSMWMISTAACARGIDPGLIEAGLDDVTGTDATMNMCTNFCTLPHATAACTAGTCLVTACDRGFADLNMHSQDGCECQVGAFADNCAMATDQGTIALGASHPQTGVLLGTTSSHWFRATFAPGGRARVGLTGGPPMSVHFEISSACSVSSRFTCPDRMQGAADLTTWEFFDNPRPDAGGSDDPVPEAGTMDDGGTSGDGGAFDAGGPTREVMAPTTVYVRVYTNAAATTCSPYTITFSN